MTGVQTCALPILKESYSSEIKGSKTGLLVKEEKGEMLICLFRHKGLPAIADICNKLYIIVNNQIRFVTVVPIVHSLKFIQPFVALNISKLIYYIICR